MDLQDKIMHVIACYSHGVLGFLGLAYLVQDSMTGFFICFLAQALILTYLTRRDEGPRLKDPKL